MPLPAMYRIITNGSEFRVEERGWIRGWRMVVKEVGYAGATEPISFATKEAAQAWIDARATQEPEPREVWRVVE